MIINMKNHKEDEQQENVKEQAVNEEAATEKTAEENIKAEVQPTELEKQTKLAKDYYDQLLRSKAEFENYRKRIEREKAELIKFGKAQILMDLLPLYDLLTSANNHLCKIKKSELAETVKGLEMIFKEFEKIFITEGIRPMDTVGKPYDPMASEILGVVDGDDSNDGLVVEELQRGFYYCNKILRPARVKIAKKKVTDPRKDKEDAKEDTEEK